MDNNLYDEDGFPITDAAPSTGQIIFRFSNEAGVRPSLNTIEEGEIFINLADGAIVSRRGGALVTLGGGSTQIDVVTSLPPPIEREGELVEFSGSLWYSTGTVWIDLNGGGVGDGDKGDITVAGSSWTINAAAVSTNELGGDITPAGKALLDDASPAAQRTTLGLGTAATQPSTAFALASHLHGIPDVGGLQAALDAKAALTHTHAIGDVSGLQGALDAKANASHTHTASQISDSTAAGRTLLTAVDAPAQRTALGLGTAATQNTGTSGSAIPRLDGVNTWSGVQVFGGAAGLEGGEIGLQSPVTGTNLTGNVVVDIQGNNFRVFGTFNGQTRGFRMNFAGGLDNQILEVLHAGNSAQVQAGTVTGRYARWNNTTGRWEEFDLLGAANTWTAENRFTGRHGVYLQDTRAANPNPGAAPITGGGGRHVTWDFKERIALGWGGSGTFGAVETISQWDDDSGGGDHQNAYSGDGRRFHRYGTRAGGWGTWRETLSSASLGSGLSYDAGTGLVSATGSQSSVVVMAGTTTGQIATWNQTTGRYEAFDLLGSANIWTATQTFSTPLRLSAADGQDHIQIGAPGAGSAGNPLLIIHKLDPTTLRITGWNGTALAGQVRFAMPDGVSIDAGVFYCNTYAVFECNSAAGTVLASPGGGIGGLEVVSMGSGAGAGAAFMTFHRPGAYAVHFGLDTDNQLKVGGWSMGAVAHVIWHAGNFDPNTKVSVSQGAASVGDPNTIGGTLSHVVTADPAGNGPHSFCTIWNFGTNGSRDGQLGWFYGPGTPQVWFRSRHDATGTWNPWVQLYHSGNSAQVQAGNSTGQIATWNQAAGRYEPGGSLSNYVLNTDFRLSDARTPTAHTHAAADVTSGTFDLARLPVAPSGSSSATQVVRADDARLSDARTPTAHAHAAGDITSGVFPIARGGTGATDAAGARANLGLGTASTANAGSFVANDSVGANAIGMSWTGQQVVVRVDATNFTMLRAGTNIDTGSISATGSITATGDITAFSDARLKTVESEVNISLSDITSVSAVNYTRDDTGDKSTGLIAQDLQRILPRLVKDHDDGLLSVDYGKAGTTLALVLAKKLEDALHRIEELEKRII